MCCKGHGVISDSVLLPFFSGTRNICLFSSVPLLFCSGLQIEMVEGFVLRSVEAYVVIPLIRNASSR